MNNIELNNEKQRICFGLIAIDCFERLTNILRNMAENLEYIIDVILWFGFGSKCYLNNVL